MCIDIIYKFEICMDIVNRFGISIDIIYRFEICIDVIYRFEICIDFENSASAAGLQWLPAEQTAGKRHPYLFSQFQSIYARTVLPCQDTPAVKHPYRAKVCSCVLISSLLWYYGMLLSACVRQYLRHGGFCQCLWAIHTDNTHACWHMY